MHWISMGFSTMIHAMRNQVNQIMKWPDDCILNGSGDILLKLKNHPMVGLRDHSMSLNYLVHTQKWEFGGWKWSGSSMTYVNTSLQQSFKPRLDSRVIIVNFISEIGQKCIRWEPKGVGTLIKVKIHTLMKRDQENTIQKTKQDNKLSKIVHVLYRKYF